MKYCSPLLCRAMKTARRACLTCNCPCVIPNLRARITCTPATWSILPVHGLVTDGETLKGSAIGPLSRLRGGMRFSPI